jgi:hypothetical protein
MSDLTKTIADGFIHCYRDFAGRVRALAEGLSEEQFWTKPYPYGNSVGNLVLHITGNLSYYVGAQIANTGYVREREQEFAASRARSKDEVLEALDEAVAIVVKTLEAETDSSWGESYSAVGISSADDRFGLYLRCAAHFQHHIGQMTYLINELPGDRAS